MATSERPPSPLDQVFLTNHPTATELILVRHGQQDFPDPKNSTVGEWVDPPLSETGERQALCVGEHLAGESVDALYSSHLVRANRTGKAIGAHHDIEPTVMEDLREIGTFRDLPQDKSPGEVIGELALSGARARFARHQTWDVYPHTEPNAEFRMRVANAVEGILLAHEGQRVVIACHGGVINAYVGEILGLDTGMFFRPAHASTHRIFAADGRRVVQSLNESHYLAAADLVTS